MECRAKRENPGCPDRLGRGTQPWGQAGRWDELGAAGQDALSRSARMVELMSQAAAEFSGFGENFLAG